MQRSTSSLHMTALRFTHIFLILAFAGPGSFAQKYSADLLASAQRGDADAQNELGISYSEGLGIKPNQIEAVNWFRKSAEQGSKFGACNLGLHYGRGLGIRRDRSLMMKWFFVANALDGLTCQPADYIEMFKPGECQIERGWELAVAWLKAHPSLKNNHDERPWLGEGKYSITVREQGSAVQLPIKSKRKCK